MYYMMYARSGYWIVFSASTKLHSSEVHESPQKALHYFFENRHNHGRIGLGRLQNEIGFDIMFEFSDQNEAFEKFPEYFI